MKLDKIISNKSLSFFGLAAGLIVLTAIIGSQTAANAQISITDGSTPYTQDFDTLSNTAGSTTNNLTITGWFMTESGGGARDNEQYAVDTGASNTGDTYSYGATAGTNRALGSLRSGTLISIFGAAFTNNTGAPITFIDIRYTGEQWRLGTAARTDQLTFEYSTDATSLTTGTWTGVPSLIFVTPNTVTTGAKDGDAAANRTLLNGTVNGLNIPNGATFWIRWNDTDASGADDGLAVDDFTLLAGSPTAAPVSVSGRITTASGRGLGNVRVVLADQAGNLRTAISSPFGYYRFDNVLSGDNYTVSVSAKGHTFVQSTRIVSVSDAVDDANFVADN